MSEKFPVPEENIKFIVNDLTPEKILKYINVEDRLRGVDIEDIVEKLSDDDIQKLKKLLSDK